MDAILSDPAQTFVQKLCGVVDIIGGTMAKASPAMFRDLQRFAPAVYQKIEDLRQETIPYVFGRLIRAGIAEDIVRSDIEPAFATEFWLQAIRGLVQPEVLERTQLTIRQTLEKAINLFFVGVLSPAGRKLYASTSLPVKNIPLSENAARFRSGWLLAGRCVVARRLFP